MSAPRRRLLVWLLPAIALLAALLGGWRVHWRAQHASSFCAGSCHAPKEGGDWHLREHANVECQSCHAVSTTAGLRLAIGGKAPHGKVAPAQCSSCHSRENAAFASTQGHRQHASAKNVDCVSCHGKTAHAEAPPEKVCTSCHAEQRLHKPTTPADAETCLSCHSFAASAKRAQPPTPKACARCHEKTTGAHVLHGGVACQLCHDAHGKKPRPPEGQPVCVRCHQIESFASARVDVKTPEGHNRCEGCHKPHAEIGSTSKVCVKCHEDRVRGGKDGKATALKHDACSSCHLPHTWRAERSGCKQCHADKASLIATRSPPQHETCTGCHDVHGPPPTGKVCVACHAKTKASHVALAPERHKDCTACHDPHAPKPEDTRNACIKCHATQVTQVTKLGPEGHDGCFGCHKPHDNPLPPADVCARCHGPRAKVVATAAPSKHRTCTSCHEKHSFAIRDTKAACSKCHGALIEAAAKHDKPPHGGACKDCHTIHGSPGIAKEACIRCHEKVAGDFHPPNEKHAVCKSCHQPHEPAITARAACGTCHEAKAAIAAKWPASSAHAQTCTGCHRAHDVRSKKTCDQCHATEATSAMGGKHQCMQCHPPHGAPPGTGSAWWSRCNSCHAAKVESVKARGPTHADCKNCHQAHRFALPSCTTCHKDIAKEGLHAVPQHAASCKSCHDPHVASAPTPAQCLGCHTDRKNHEPNAKQCQACHMFR